MSQVYEIKERPILFAGRLVRAILDGIKTQTRRVIRPQPFKAGEEWSTKTVNQAWNGGFVPVRCPFGEVGTRLWVRETWCHAVDPISSRLNGKYLYRADERSEDVWLDDGDGSPKLNRDGTFASPWRPSIFMPRVASRIQLEVTNIRIQRLREIAFEDIKAEGVRIPAKEGGGVLLQMSGKHAPIKYLPPSKAKGRDWTADQLARAHFASGWDSLNAERGFGWGKNPWVWVIDFKRVEVARG